jgi:hypothetical protein
MRSFIFLDTNNWIYLSNGFNVQSNKHDDLHLKVFDIIQKRVEDGNLVFLVNDVVIDEWNRNKEQTKNQLKDIENKYKSYKSQLSAIEDFIQDEFPETKGLKEILEDKYKEKIERHKKHINDVEDFLIKKTVKISITDNNKIESSNLALEKKAPFIGDKKNSMADALILLSSIEHIQNNEKIPLPTFDDTELFEFPESFFVSSNKGDFCSPGDKEKIHPDLESFLDRTKTKFFFTLGKLINSLEEKFLSEEEEELIEYTDDRQFCEVCNYEHYPTVEFSEHFKVFDPKKHYSDPRQLKIKFEDYEHELDEEEDDTDNSSFSRIRTADCNHCGAEFIECTCGELTQVHEYNSEIECEGGCGNKFIVHAEIDKKGMVHSLEYEIVEEYECKTCGYMFSSVDDSGNCEECAEYEKAYIEE